MKNGQWTIEMKKILLYVAPVFFAFVVFLVVQLVLNRNPGKGALQVTSVPKSVVYLNGRAIGQTPLCKCEPQDMISSGEYTIRLVPQEGSFSPFEEKIKISKSILTVVDRTFGQGALSEGNVINLTPLENSKDLELLIMSFPDNAQVLINNSPSGNTPLLLKNLTESDHEIKVIKDGYKEKTIRIKTVKGYRLTAEIFLGVNPDAVKIEPINPASPSGTIVPSGTITPSVSPAAKSKISPTPSVPTVIILQTPTGFLRVRDAASLGGAEIARVNPDESYELVAEQSGWYQIKLKDGRLGWISSQYAQKQ